MSWLALVLSVAIAFTAGMVAGIGLMLAGVVNGMQAASHEVEKPRAAEPPRRSTMGFELN